MRMVYKMLQAVDPIKSYPRPVLKMKSIVLLAIVVIVGICQAQMAVRVPFYLTGNADGSVQVTLGTFSATLQASDLATLNAIITYVQTSFGSVKAGATTKKSFKFAVNENGAVTETVISGKRYTIAPTLGNVLLQLLQVISPALG